MITWHCIHHMPWTVFLSTTSDTGALPRRMATSTTNFTVHFSLPDALAFVNRRVLEVATSSFWADLAPSWNISSWVWRLIVHKHIFQSVYHPTYALLWYTIYDIHQLHVSALRCHPQGVSITKLYRVIKKSLCTWWLQYRKLQVMFKVSPASLHTFIDRASQGDTRLTLTPSVIPISNYIIMVGVWNFLKYCIFACVLYCNHRVHRDFLIPLYKPTCHSRFCSLLYKWLES
jgi:hypothetical protein